MSYIIFNNMGLEQFGVYYDGSHLFDTPEKDVTFFSVPGKNGDLSISNDRFKNIELRIPCFIRTNFQQNFSDLVNYLYSQEGYCDLETTTEPDIIRSASFVSALQPDTGAFLKYGTFTLVFNCKPQKWLRSGRTAQNFGVGNTTITVVNPTSFTAKPLFQMQGTGRITIGENEVYLTQNTSTTEIDCEMQNAREGDINRNPDLQIVYGFPVLAPGTNQVVVSQRSGSGDLLMIPRWWKI